MKGGLRKGGGSWEFLKGGLRKGEGSWEFLKGGLRKGKGSCECLKGGLRKGEGNWELECKSGNEDCSYIVYFRVSEAGAVYNSMMLLPQLPAL